MMVPWLRQQWNDIKGHVKFAVLLFVGGSVVTLVVALTHGLVLWQQVVLAGCFVFLFGWALFETMAASSHHLPGSRPAGLPTQPEAQQETVLLKQKLREAENEIASIKRRFLDDAPGLTVRYDHAVGIQPMLTLINDSGKVAVSAKFDPPFVISKEPNGGVFRHELMTIPSVVSLIAGSAQGQCKLIMKDVKRNSICPLEDILSGEMADTVDIVTLNYDDSVGREFARDFTLRRYIDGNVGWKPGPIRLRGPNVAP